MHKYGWISPEGYFFGCDYYDHGICAEAIVESLFPDEKGDAERILEKHNYLRITKGTSNHRRADIFFDGSYKNITNDQFKIIQQLGYDLNNIIALED